MKLTLVRKTELSHDTNCPALYRITDTGGYVVVGKRVTDPAELAQLTAGLGADEYAVEIPADVLDRDLIAAWEQPGALAE